MVWVSGKTASSGSQKPQLSTCPHGGGGLLCSFDCFWSQMNLNFLSNKKSMKSLVLRPRCPTARCNQTAGYSS